MMFLTFKNKVDLNICDIFFILSFFPLKEHNSVPKTKEDSFVQVVKSCEDKVFVKFKSLEIILVSLYLFFNY